MSPDVESLIIDRIDAVERHLSSRLDSQDRVLRAISTSTPIELDKLDARLVTLEQARERTRGVKMAFRWVPEAVITLLGAGVTVLVMSLTGAIH